MAVSSRDGRARVQACIDRALAAGEPFPTARRIREETGLSLSTVHKHIHTLAGQGRIALPPRYPAPPVREHRRILAVRRKRVLLSGGESVTLSLIIAEETDGRYDTDIVAVETSSTCPPARKVLACQDVPCSLLKRG